MWQQVKEEDTLSRETFSNKDWRGFCYHVGIGGNIHSVLKPKGDKWELRTPVYGEETGYVIKEFGRIEDADEFMRKTYHMKVIEFKYGYEKVGIH